MVDAVDMRGRPLTERRSLLEELVYVPREGLSLSEAYDGPGDVLLRHAYGLNLEGIASKQRSSRYRSGRSDDWRKIKCPGYQRRQGAHEIPNN